MTNLIAFGEEFGNFSILGYVYTVEPFETDTLGDDE